MNIKTVRTGKVDKLSLRLVEKDRAFIGVIFATDGTKKAQIEGADADDVWRRLHDAAGKANPKYFGFSGARARFLHWFAGGFGSPNYLAEERSYKLDAKHKLDLVPVEEAATGSGYGQAVWKAYQTNMLSPYEKMWVRDALLSQDADDFVRGAARFTLGEGKPALLQMEQALKRYGAAKWTIVTYLPFLWQPDEHMYLKPEATKDFAERVGHSFANEYEPKLNFAVYESLVDLAARTAEELTELKPRDRIDVQSFIWVVGDYREGRETPKP